MCRGVGKAEQEARSTSLEAYAAVKTARKAAARLRGSEEEVGPAQLVQIAESRLTAWLGWMASRRSLEPQLSLDSEQANAPPFDSCCLQALK